MSKERQSSVDGFVPRRPNDRLGSLHNDRTYKKRSTAATSRKQLNSTNIEKTRLLGQRKAEYGLGRADIDESLRKIDKLDKPPKKLSRRQRLRLAKMARRPNKKLRILKKFAILMAIVILGIGGYMGYKFIKAGNSIVRGSIFDLLKSQPLKQDSNGRSNFLILGTSEDDTGHAGADLTDSMMVVSVDQTNKNAYMFSVPRDLYVEYGLACVSGYSGKINAYFTCSNGGTTDKDEQDRLSRTQKFVGDIFGIDIQYSIHANHTVIKQVIDAIGGIDVDIQGSNGAPGILDRNFDWRCKYTCYYVKYENGVHHLDGEHALFLSMARGDVAPTYGLGNSNFDREKNQQKILVAARNKALSVGTLTNLGAITKMIDALGDNLRTNIKTSEIRTILQVANDMKSSDIHTLSLVDENNRVMTTGNYNGASVVMPAAGIYDYSEIQAFIRKNLSTDPVERESAPIVVLNGTNEAGLGRVKADILIEEGYNVQSVGNAPEGKYDRVEIYQIGTKSPGTAKKLASRYGVKIKTATPPAEVDEGVQFVIIIGSADETSN